VQGASKTIVSCLEAYVAQGNTVEGCNVTVDRAYGHVQVGCAVRYSLKIDFCKEANMGHIGIQMKFEYYLKRQILRLKNVFGSISYYSFLKYWKSSIIRIFGMIWDE
jgi:hypothetical protein